MVGNGCMGASLQLLCKYQWRWVNQPPCRLTPYYCSRERVRKNNYESGKKRREDCHDDFYIAPTAPSLGTPLVFLSLLHY